MALVCLVLTSLQAAFLYPDFTLIPGERAKVFTGLLCALSLLSAVLLTTRRLPGLRSPELWVSLVLTILICLSGLSSGTPQSSLLRGFVIIASGLGGFWCARLLLATRARQVQFLWFSLALLLMLLAFALLSYFLTGRYHLLLDVNEHPLFSRIILLSFAPIALLFDESRRRRLLGVLILCLDYTVCYLSTLRSAVLMPLILGGVALALKALRPRYFLGLVIVIGLVIICFLNFFPERKFRVSGDYEAANYRAENYPFSWHIAGKHPWLGNGLRAPRQKFLDDYRIKTSFVNRENFAESMGRIVVSENIFLTFMADLGFPFVILYSGSLVIIFAWLIRWVKNPPPSMYLPPLALLLPLTAALVHFLIYDGLFHPQVSWFFHILLGLVPTRAENPTYSVQGS